jgi:hypothetical protein
MPTYVHMSATFNAIYISKMSTVWTQKEWPLVFLAIDFRWRQKQNIQEKKNHQRRMNNKIPCAVKKTPQPRYVYTLGNLYVFSA